MSKKQTILTSTDKELMLSKSAYVLPDNPSSKQMSASQIRKKLYEAYIVLFDWLSRAIVENNENVDLNDTQITTILENISALQGYFTDDKAKKAIADEDGNTIKVTYGSSLEGSLITEDGNQKVEFNFKNKNGDTLSKPIIALSEVHLAESGSPATDFSGLISPTDKRKINALDTTFLKLTDVINDLTTGGVTKGLSAEQGKILKGLIDAIKKNSYQLVDTSVYTTLNAFLQSTGEEGYIYLYPINLSDLTKGYYQYIWENSAWLSLGTTQIDLVPYMKKVADSALDMQGNNINNIRNLIASGDAINIKSTDSSQTFSVDLYNSGSGEYADIKLSKTKGNTLKQLTFALLNDLIDIDIQTTDANKHTLYSDVVDINDDGSVDFINGAKSSVVPQDNNDLTNKEYVDTKIASSEKAVANGVATLDENGKIPLEQIPSNLINYKVFTRRFYGSSMTGDLYIDGVKREDIVANIGTDDGVKVRNDFDDMPFFGEINKVSLRAKDSDGNDLSDTNGTPIYDDFVFIPNYWYKVENGTDSSGNEYTDFSISTEEKTGYTRMKVNDDGSIPSHIGIGAYQSTYTLTSNSSYMCGSQKGQPICVSRNVDQYRSSYRYCLDYEHGIDTLTRIGSCSTQELDLPIIAMIIEFGNRNVQALFGGYLQGAYSGYQYLDATFKSYQSTEVCNYFIFPKASWTNFVSKGLGVGSFMSFYSFYADEYDRTSSYYWSKLTITAIEEYIVDEEVVGYKVSFDKSFTPSKNAMIGEFIAEEVGTTESIISSSGYKSNRNFGLRSFTYRGIENLWGGFRTLTDKLFLKCTYENGVKTKLDIVKSDGTSTTDNWQTYQANVLPFLNGTSTNQTGYIKVFDFKKGMLLPKELQSGGSTYYNAWFGCYNNTQTFFNIIRGGYWYNGSDSWGLYWDVVNAWSRSSNVYAIRPILYKNAS